MPEQRLWRSLRRLGVVGVLVAVAVTFVDVKLNSGLPVVLCLVLPTTLLLLIRLIRWSLADLPGPDPAAEDYVAGSAELGRLRLMERRLSASSRDGVKFDADVQPELAQLALDRLRLTTGLDRRRNPEQARAVLGEQLWQLINRQPEDRPSPPLTRARLATLVAAIEAIK